MKKLSILHLFISILFFSCSKKEKIIFKSNANNILSFSFESFNPPIKAIIDSTKLLITAKLPNETDARKITPIITISDKATISPNSGTIQDFTQPIVYTVIAEDGSQKKYTTRIEVLKSSANSILDFSFNLLESKVSGVIDSVKKTITLTLPEGTDLNKLTPSISISKKATIFPYSELSQDFTKPVIYIVTAENGNTEKYTVYINTLSETLTIETGNSWSIYSFQLSTFESVITKLSSDFYVSPSKNTGVFLFDSNIKGSHELQYYPKNQVKCVSNCVSLASIPITSDTTIYAILKKVDNSSLITIDGKSYKKIKITFRNNTFFVDYITDYERKIVQVLTEGLFGDLLSNSKGEKYLRLNDINYELK